MCLHEYMGVNLSILVCQYMCIHVYVSFYPKAWCICHNVNIRVCLKIKPCRIDENRQTMLFSRKSKPLNKIIYNNTIHGSSLGFKLASYTWLKKILQTSAYLIKPRLGNQWFDFLLVKGSLYIYISAFGGFTCPKLTPSTRRCVTQRVKESHIIPIIFQGNGRNKNKGTHMSYI